MNKSLILNRIKLAYSLKNDAELARFLEIQRNTLSNWYSRNTIDYDKVFLKCESLNFDWLLTGQGPMLKEYSYLEQKNWIVNDLDKYESQKYDYNSLQLVGLRLDEISIQEKIAYDLMAKKLCVDHALFMEYISGSKPVPCSLLNKLSELFPHLNESWLHLGYGAMIVDKQQASSSNDKYIEALEKINTLQEQIINLMQENKRLTEEITAFQESPQDRAAG